MLIMKKNIEYNNDYLLHRRKSEDAPPKLNYLIAEQEIHQTL